MTVTENVPLRVGIIVFDDVEVLDCCGPFEVFSVANRVCVSAGIPEAFDVKILSTQPNVTARGGLVLQSHDTLQNTTELDILLVGGGVTSDAEKDAELLRWVDRIDQDTRWTTSVCTGAFILAEAGILTEQRVTTHWEDQDELQTRWPGLEVVRNGRWIRDGKYLTSAGISAGLDLSLHLVELCLGESLAQTTARQMDYNWVRAEES